MEEISQLSKMAWKKGKTYLIELVSKWKGTNTKGHTSFLLFRFWDLKLVPIDSVLYQIILIIFFFFFFPKMYAWHQEKQGNFKIQLKFFWNVLNVGTKMCLQIYKVLSNFDSNFLIWYPTLFPCKIAQILQNIFVFFRERREEIEPWFWHIWIAQWLNFFP